VRQKTKALGMTAGDGYRIKAAEMSAKARDQANPELRAAFEQLVLADHADGNATYAVETHPAPAMLQQQQPQPTNKSRD
jgi:hypothetical protein